MSAGIPPRHTLTARGGPDLTDRGEAAERSQSEAQQHAGGQERGQIRVDDGLRYLLRQSNGAGA